MTKLPINQAEAYSLETFQCASCDREFDSKIITWVDVSRTPQVKQLLLKWEFNVVQCPSCGCRNPSSTPFFYEDFEEGLLVAVFPRIPENREDVERGIRKKYGYYPVLEFFYDMTQIWMLIYFQGHYKTNKNQPGLSRTVPAEERLRKVLRFLKEDPLMIAIREKLTESFFRDETSDELTDILGQAVYTLEGMLPWPLDRRCLCGADLTAEFKCCGSRINLNGHNQLLSPRYSIYCPMCKEALSGATCGACGREYTWKLGVVDSHAAREETAHGGVRRVSRQPEGM